MKEEELNEYYNFEINKSIESTGYKANSGMVYDWKDAPDNYEEPDSFISEDDQRITARDWRKLKLSNRNKKMI